MGLFNFLDNVVSAATKVVLTPVAVAVDVVKLEPFETTGELLDSAGDD